MKVLLDTNIILDYLLKREPFYADAKRIFDSCLYSIDGLVTPHSLIDIFYMLSERTDSSEEYCRSTILKLKTVLYVVSETDSTVFLAIKNNDFKDFEDSIQHECAIFADADYIITRNAKDFSASKILVLSPADFFDIQH